MNTASSTMITASDVIFSTYKYNQCPKRILSQLFKLRYSTFKERLKWEVRIHGNHEFDEYDDKHTTYIVGEYLGEVICSVRFICISFPNMITDTFGDFFDISNLINKSIYIESSRFFVDKKLAQKFKLKHISSLLFLEMFSYAKGNNYTAILTIVSESMLCILNNSGWDFDILQEAQYNQRENIFLIKLLLNNKSLFNLTQKISSLTAIK